MDKTIGCYVLFFEIDKEVEVQIGKLGDLRFEKGLYAYVGSAMNSLEIRTQRHVQMLKIHEGNSRWHIDYLLKNKHSRLVGLIKIPTNERIECRISKMFEMFAQPIIGFGSSDCRCKGHLYYVSRPCRRGKPGV